jgi:NAD(P)-dependent dehydrogenase (short-subunit alcohol dehydrogenase family)
MMANILITGCSSGFGYLSALDLARRGERVFATMRNLVRGQALTKIAISERLALTTHTLDVTDPMSVRRCVAEVLELGGKIDVLVNNAGYAQRGPIETLSDEEIHRQFDTNVTGIMRMVRTVVPHMRARNAGTIINLSSLSGLTGVPYEGAYSASKHAVEAISQALRFELAATSIRVLLIEPGAFETGFVNNAPVAADFNAAHPLWDEYQRFWSAAAQLTGGSRADPQAVVDAIRRAVIDPETPFRQLVGADVEFAVSLQEAAGLADLGPTIREILHLPATGKH